MIGTESRRPKRGKEWKERMKKVFLALLVLVMIVSVSTLCAAKGNEYCEENGHTEVGYPDVAPTCTEEGLTGGSYCSVCDKVLSERTKVPALDHLFIAWYPTGNGRHLMLCKRDCGYEDLQFCRMAVLPQADPEAAKVSFCPICGYCTGAKESTSLRSLKILSGAPRGSLRVFRLNAGESGRYMTVAFEYGGELVQPAGTVSFSLPEELQGISFAQIDAEGGEEIIESTTEQGMQTLTLDFKPEGEDPVKVIILKEI